MDGEGGRFFTVAKNTVKYPDEKPYDESWFKSYFSNVTGSTPVVIGSARMGLALVTRAINSIKLQ